MEIDERTRRRPRIVSDVGDKGAQNLFYGAVKISSKGQIVIPQRVREDFGLQTGDQLIVIGRPEQEGFALMKPDAFLRFQQELARMQAELNQFRIDGASLATNPDDASRTGGSTGS
jgi:AbrB family looped-hinge helix DNA binding protein